MFRALVYDRTLPKRTLDLEELERKKVSGSRSSVKANLCITKASITEDLEQRASSTIYVVDIPEEVKINDIIAIYDNKGQFIYWGVIESIGDKELHVNQIQSLFNSETLAVAVMLAGAAGSKIPAGPICTIMSYELMAKICGLSSIAVIGGSSLSEEDYSSGVIDKGIFDLYNFVEGIIPIDNTEEYFPVSLDDLANSTNLEEYLYDCFKSYTRIIIPVNTYLLNKVDEDGELNHSILQEEWSWRDIASENERSIEVDFSLSEQEQLREHGPGGLTFLIVNIPDFLEDNTITAPIDKTPWKEGTLFDTYENISDVSIVKENEDVDTVYVYGSIMEFLGGFTLTNDGQIVPIENNKDVPNRLGPNKIKYVFENELLIEEFPENIEALVRKELPVEQFNHKITFDIMFNDNNKFSQYKLGKKIRFYEKKTNRLFNSMLTAWDYEIEENSDVIKKARFTLGKARTSLTGKLNKKKETKENGLSAIIYLLLKLIGG